MGSLGTTHSGDDTSTTSATMGVAEAMEEKMKNKKNEKKIMMKKERKEKKGLTSILFSCLVMTPQIIEIVLYKGNTMAKPLNPAIAFWMVVRSKRLRGLNVLKLE